MTAIAAAPEDGSAEPSSETRHPQTSSSETHQPDAQASGVDGTPDSRPAKEAKTGTSTESTVLEAAAALPQVLKIVGSVVAPTTLLTALLFYFGRVYAASSFWYFGVQFTVLDLAVQDYLIRSVDASIIPLIALVGAALLALWIYQVLPGALPTGARRVALRVLMPSALTVGLVLVSLALADLRAPVFPADYPELRGLSFSIGVLLLAYGVRLLRLLIAEKRPERLPRRPQAGMVVAEWGALFILVSVGLFWAVGSYAFGAGTGIARQVEAALPTFPDAVLYSQNSLSLGAPGVREVTCQNPEPAYRFRYDGLKLMLQSGNQYLFFPTGWTHENGAAILIPRSEALRLEFSPAGQARSATC